MVFRDGVLLFSQPGMLPAAALEELLAKVRALDMAAVLAESVPASASVPAGAGVGTPASRP
jgi:thioredoxin 1